MTQEDIINILTDVYVLTESHHIIWTSTSTDAQFMTTLGDATLSIDQFTIDNNSFSHTIVIFNNKGNAIFKYDTLEGDNTAISTLVAEIYNLVENYYYRKDETIRSLRAALESLKRGDHNPK